MGVGGVVVHDGRVLLVRRGKEPLRGRWVVPGGAVELGETLEDAVAREVREETGILVRPLEVMTVFDRIERKDGAVAYHYVVVDYRCAFVSGRAEAASDALEAAWVAEGDLDRYELPSLALDLVRRAFRTGA
ncbi:MAG TPA: NUDIX hydrolase [Vicinamibacteria bacterium]|nr:NUDIX hydrolase [Vicinamibacteria bacterium]